MTRLSVINRWKIDWFDQMFVKLIIKIIGGKKINRESWNCVSWFKLKNWLKKIFHFINVQISILFYYSTKFWNWEEEREGEEGIIITHWIKISNYLFYKLYEVYFYDPCVKNSW